MTSRKLVAIYIFTSLGVESIRFLSCLGEENHTYCPPDFIETEKVVYASRSNEYQFTVTGGTSIISLVNRF